MIENKKKKSTVTLTFQVRPEMLDSINNKTRVMNLNRSEYIRYCINKDLSKE